MSEILVIEDSVKDRLERTFRVLIEQAEINPMLTSVVESFFTKFMNTTDEAALVDLLIQLRDEIIPCILEGKE